MKPLNKKPYFGALSLSELQAVEPYQRSKLNARVVKEIARNFDPVKAGTILVSRRGGKYHVIDGRHRVTGALQANLPKDYKINCQIVEGLTYYQEAELFAKQDKNKTPLSAVQEFNGLLEAQDEESVSIQQNLERIGLRIDTTNSRCLNDIQCVRQIQRLYRTLGGAEFFSLMNLIKQTWGGDVESLSAQMIGGCATFYKTYRGEFNQKTFVKKLNTVKPSAILREGRSDTSATGDLRFAKIILKKYNYKVSSANTLPYRFLG